MSKIIADIGVDRAHTAKGRKCLCCGEHIQRGEKYLHINRNNHLYILCGKCSVIIALCLKKDESLPKGLHKTWESVEISFQRSGCAVCHREESNETSLFIHLLTAKTFCYVCLDCLAPHVNQMLKENPMVKADVTAQLI